MTPDQHLIVYCPKCGKPHRVSATDKKFSCDECRIECAIAQPANWVEVVGTIAELKTQIASITKGVQEPGGVAEDSVQELKKLSQRLEGLEDWLSRVRSPVGDVKFSPEDQYLVSLDKVKSLNEADQEWGVTFSVFTLLLGLTVQELLNRGQWTSTVSALALSTVILGGFAVYTFIRTRRRKREVEQKAQDNVITIEGILGARSVKR